MSIFSVIMPWVFISQPLYMASRTCQHSGDWYRGSPFEKELFCRLVAHPRSLIATPH